MSEERTRISVKCESVKNGDLMAFVYWAKVDHTSNNNVDLHVQSVDGNKQKFSVLGRELVEGSFSADQIHEERQVSKTKAAEILVSLYNRPFTVVFEKDDGSERKLRGRLISAEPLLGRSMVEDLDISDAKNRVRLVDHRTLKSITCEGVLYRVK